jgi:hypothetical protein
MGAGCGGRSAKWRRARPSRLFSGRKEGSGCSDGRQLAGSSGASSCVMRQRGAGMVTFGRQGHALVIAGAPVRWGLPVQSRVNIVRAARRRQKPGKGAALRPKSTV